MPDIASMTDTPRRSDPSRDARDQDDASPTAETIADRLAIAQALDTDAPDEPASLPVEGNPLIDDILADAEAAEADLDAFFGRDA